MIELLNIKNYALIDEINISFGPGLNVITGETGAGKSILAGALNLALGNRADKHSVRAGADSCVVEAVFALSDMSKTSRVLEESGIEADDGQIIVRRIVSAAGTSRCYVNDRPVTLQTLKQLGEQLVDMHGAYEHQSLLQPGFQLEVIDAFSGSGKIKIEYAAAYEKYKEAEKELERLQAQSNDPSTGIDILEFQIKEIENAGISEEDEHDIGQEHMLLANSQRISELTNNIINMLTENEISIAGQIGMVRKDLEELVSLTNSDEEWENEVIAIASQVQELSSAMASLAASIESDPGRLSWLEERIMIYQELKRKYGGTTSSVLQFLDKAKTRLSELSNRDEILDEMRKKVQSLKKELLGIAARLSEKRKNAAKKLARQVARELRELAFQKSEFNILFRTTDPGPEGTDAIEFVFAPNHGEPARDLRAVASSGEMSRVMLAVKGVLAAADRIPVLVFDEIDANIGGRTGTAVGRKLAALAKTHQTLCITHLPQVAVWANYHFGVKKELTDKRTVTGITPLENDDRVEEIARMLGGSESSSTTITHAREMLAQTGK